MRLQSPPAKSKFLAVLLLLFVPFPAWSDLVVTSTDDDGPGTLRQAVLDIEDSSTITFDPALSGQTIQLSTGHLYLRKSVTIDGSGLSRAIKIDAGEESRVIRIKYQSGGDLEASGTHRGAGEWRGLYSQQGPLENLSMHSSYELFHG
jgi:hypothetical protein